MTFYQAFLYFFDKQKWGGDSEDHDASHRYDPGSKPGGNTIILGLFYTKLYFMSERTCAG